MVSFLKRLAKESKVLLLMLGFLILALALSVPKVYVRNNIYYTSEEIDDLYTEYLLLKEENKVLKSKLESIRFHNQIDDILLYKKLEK